MRHATRNKQMVLSLLKVPSAYFLIYDEAREREETNEVSGFELHVACFTWKDDARDRHEAKRNGGHMPRDLRGMEVHVLCCYTTKLVSEKMTKANILLSDSLFKISATFWSGYGDKVVITGS